MKRYYQPEIETMPVEQIQALTAAGCDIISCAVPTMEAAEALSEIK